MNTKKDIIVSGFSNFSIKKLTPWLKSMERVGFNGDLLCVVYGDNPDLIESANFLRKIPNCTVIQGIFTREVMFDRFKDIKNYLNDKKNKYRYVFATDAGDVVFQKNPSKYAEYKLSNKYKILCGSESMIYKDESWGNECMKTRFPQYYDFMKDKIIYNAGTITGEIETICNLFEQIYTMCISQPLDCPDQHAFNILIQTIYKDVTYFSSIEDGYATQCNTTANPRLLKKYDKFLLEKPILKDGIAYNSKMEPTCLLHQYPNVPGFYAIGDVLTTQALAHVAHQAAPRRLGRKRKQGGHGRWPRRWWRRQPHTLNRPRDGGREAARDAARRPTDGPRAC